MNKIIISILCLGIAISCKKESKDPAKYQLKSYTILTYQFNTSNVRDSVLIEYRNGQLNKLTSFYKYDLNSAGPTKVINLNYSQNKIQSAVITKDNQSVNAGLEYDNENLLKRVETPNSTFTIRYNTLKKVSGLNYSFNNFYDFEYKNENLTSISRNGAIQTNEYNSANNPFSYLPDDAKILMMAEFGNSIFLNYFNSFSKNLVTNYSKENSSYIIDYKLNKANLPTESIITSNSQKIAIIKFYY